MPHVFICHRCAEKIDGDKQDWVIVSVDTSGISGLEVRAHAECEVKRLKEIQMKGIQAPFSLSRGLRA